MASINSLPLELTYEILTSAIRQQIPESTAPLKAFIDPHRAVPDFETLTYVKAADNVIAINKRLLFTLRPVLVKMLKDARNDKRAKSQQAINPAEYLSPMPGPQTQEEWDTESEREKKCKELWIAHYEALSVVRMLELALKRVESAISVVEG